MSRPKKSLGQNFLHDDNVARKIVGSMRLRTSDRVLEIGPGKGALTALLLEELAGMTAVELDDELARALEVRFGKKLTLYRDDVLNLDIRSLAANSEAGLRIVGNIPYNITSPILFWIIDASRFVADATLMMQREVAQRLIAKPRSKEYGVLSVLTQYYSSPKILFNVSAGSFYPVPDVQSAVVSLEFISHPKKRALDDALFRAVVRGTFGKRRKTLRNGLRAINVPLDALKDLATNLDRRPEELSVREFADLSNELYRMNINVKFNESSVAHG